MNTTYTDLFDIKYIIKILKEKKLSKGEYIFFSTSLPKIDDINSLEIKEGKSSAFILNTNYFLTYGMLHEFVQLFNKMPKETFNYYCKDILYRKEMDISTLAKIISKREKIPYDSIKIFDYSNKDFFESDVQKKGRGSDMNNPTYCYNNKISMKVLKIFLENVNEENKFLIKFPNIVSIATIDFLKILCYVFNNIKIFKILEDSFFKDSFHILCDNINVKRYNLIKQIILKENKRISFENANLMKILKINLNNTSKEFEHILRDFTVHLQILIFTFFFTLVNAINKDKNNAFRKNETWEHLDYYNNFLNNK